MYLTAKKYLSPYEKESAKKSKKISKIIGTDLIAKEIEFDLGYWRKANAIHGWFVKNVQDGVDDCRTYWVSPEKLRELGKLVKQVLRDKTLASQLLPSTSGFFFGATEYDEYYFESLKETKEIVEKAIKLNNEFEIYYSSSW